MRSTMRKGTLMMAAATTLAACEDGATYPRFDGAPAATLSFAVPAQGAPSATRFGGPAAVVVTDVQGRTLDVQQIQVVMEEIELKRALHDECVADDDACEYFEVGPVLLDLPAGGGVITPFDVPIPADTYVELELEIDDAEDDSTSARFFADNPGWPQDAAMRVVGTFDANDGAGPQAFDVFLEVSAEIERALVPALVVTDSAQDVNVTVEIDVAAWVRGATGELIDPRTLTEGSVTLDVVEQNIEESFEAFEDEDRDGESDDDPSGDDDATADQGSGDN